MCPKKAATSREALEAQALRHVESLVERNRQQTGLDGGSTEPRPVRSVGILGAGMMGTEIAAVHLRQNLPVVITDADPAVLEAARGKIAAELADDLPAGKPEQLVNRLVRPTADAAAVARCDLVIESIVETLSAKQQLYARLQGQLAGGTLLASNTSTIPIGRLAEACRNPGRFCGLHFCHPVRRRPLVEVVRGQRTSDETVATAVAHVKALGMMPVVVADGPGFLVNRLLLPYLGEALELLLEGAGIEEVERAATEFGMAKGPLTLLDEIGLDTTLQGGWILSEAFPDRIAASPLLVAMVKAGRLGRKTGAGFFSYPGGPAQAGQGRPEAAVEPIIAQWARPPKKHSPDAIIHRLILPMVLEATRILEEGKVRDAGDIDLGVIFGLGFPGSRGGLLWWADTLGAARIVQILQTSESLGPRVRPTPILEDLATTGGRFYDLDVPGQNRTMIYPG